MMRVNQSALIDSIADAARKAFLSLIAEHPGHYYYYGLVTTGEAHPPIVSAWSHEALAAAIAEYENPEGARWVLKWSYADSPFCCYGEECFETVKRLFSERPQLTPDLTDEQWEAEYQLRLSAMEAAMAKLDQEGVFGEGEARLGAVVLVEVMPPDYTNTERALRLNSPLALRDWLKEAAEENVE